MPTPRIHWPPFVSRFKGNNQSKENSKEIWEAVASIYNLKQSASDNNKLGRYQAGKTSTYYIFDSTVI